MAVSFCPEGCRTVTPHLVLRDATKAIEFYQKAFGATTVMCMPGPDGKGVMHAELKIGDSLIFLADEWHGMYAIRCQPSFPLQIFAIWKLQGLTTKEKVVPEQAREIKLVEPAPTKTATIDTTAGKPPKGRTAANASFWPIVARRMVSAHTLLKPAI